MKTAIYIQDGVLQLVLTPETETDKRVVDTLANDKTTTIYRGSFYECVGGWVKQGSDDRSLIIVSRPKKDSVTS